MSNRRSDYDITNTVQVSDPAAVATAVVGLYKDLYEHQNSDLIERAFSEFALIFRGEHPDYHGCETTYHDLQHSLDVTLTMSRLIHGHESGHAKTERLGPERALVGLITALYHDVGYIRSIDDKQHRDGAEYTRTHVSRSGLFLEDYLPRLNLGHTAKIASTIVHFTGYEVPLDQIRVNDPKYIKLGHLLGTADMLAQMSDRCYLEKCRDRLYNEFVLGGVARQKTADGELIVIYKSPEHLLEKTPGFVTATLTSRLGRAFNNAYRYAEVFFGGRNPYMEQIDRHMRHLEYILETDSWHLLRRKPPCYNVEYFRGEAGLDDTTPPTIPS
ncbi:MAG: HD domain-containing protein [Gammaproteobacteria bacterium]|nr:HD domain-containing protein [Gammaproteobacteria bacterium]